MVTPEHQRTGSWKQRACAAITETALACSPSTNPLSVTGATSARAASSAFHTIQEMADHVRFKIALAVFAYDLLAVPVTGSRFHRLSPDRRKRLWNWTRTLPIPLARDFSKLFETLGVLGEHS